ncbi:unnamed protein product [Amoebophrya sp. A120]|nr:unnamed protein product [Amoebophrya sp. A120]|eukprot:GSA120T00026431001.1
MCGWELPPRRCGTTLSRNSGDERFQGVSGHSSRIMCPAIIAGDFWTFRGQRDAEKRQTAATTATIFYRR